MNERIQSRRLFDQTTGFLQRSLDLRSPRHRILSSNIANSETRGYAPKDIPFQSILERSINQDSIVSLRTTHPRHLPEELITSIEVETLPGEVNIDHEMAKLAENNLRFQAEVQALIKKFEGLKYAISEGR